MKFGKCLCAVTALAAGLTLTYPVAAQEASDRQVEQAEEAGPALPPPVVVSSVPSQPPKENAGPVAEVPPPSSPGLMLPSRAPPPPVSRSRLDRTPPINVAGPYPENQLPVTQLIGTEKKLKWRQVPAVFLPGLTQSGRERILEKDTLVEIPLYWGMSAYLQGDVTIEGVGDPVVLKAGDVIPQVVLEDEQGIDGRFTLFCTRSRILQRGSGLGDKIFNSMRDAQWCLQDTDSDGSFDIAVALSAGAPVTKAKDIAPIPYEMRYGQLIPGDGNFVRFSMVQVSKKFVSIALNVFQSGEPMAFDTMTTGIYTARAFNRIRYLGEEDASATILGVNFKVHFADRKANLAEVEWGPAPFSSSSIIPIPTRLTTSTY